MSIEELLKPRFKVIALWPFENEGEIGTIYTEPTVHRGGQWTNVWAWWDELSKHPHLFKKLEWWEEREEKDMPEYVKFLNSPIVWKIKKWDYKWFNRPIPEIEQIDGEFFTIKHHFDKNNMFPATKEEYDQYKNKNEKPEL